MPDASENSRHSRLLVVDDDANQLSTLVGVFETEGFAVVGCSTGAEALEHLGDESIGVAVVDFRLPDLNGIELLAKLETLSEPVQVIIHTAYGSYESAKDAVNLGAFAYVEKGTEHNELIRHVHRAFRTRLEQHAAQLEDAVAERTAELQETNEALRQEIAERAQAEKTLRESEQRFRLLYERSPLGYQSLDEQGRFLEVNDAWLQALGYTRDEVIGRWFGDFMTAEYVERFKERFPRFMAMGDISNAPLELIRKNGSPIAVEIDGKVGYDNEGNFQQTHCILRDVTRRKQMESLVRAQRDLALALSNAIGLDEGLRLSVEAALRTSGMDAGGVYLVDERSGAVDLLYHQGLSEDFIGAVSRFDRDSDHARLVMAGEPVYATYDDVPVAYCVAETREGLRALTVLPIKHEGRVIGCLNVASRALSAAPPLPVRLWSRLLRKSVVPCPA